MLATMRKRRLTQAVVRKLLEYDPASGVLTWRQRDRRWFKTDRAWASWNAKHAGRPALASRDTHGYLAGKIFGRMYRAHRVIWLHQKGARPPVVEHENHNRRDNRLLNLR
jgi:hypothetical protein